MDKTYPVRNYSFTLAETKAEAVRAAKRVINSTPLEGFDLFPVKYEWAFEKYAAMMANHWEPEDIQMQRDVEQWRSEHITPNERWIIMMGIGYFSAAEGIVGDNIQHVVRDLVSAPELKLVLGRHAHEENIHADSLLYMISSLGIDPHECEAMFEQIPSIVKKNEFVTRHSNNLRGDLDLTSVAGKQLLARNMFVFGQCMEGTQFYGLFGMILSLYRQGKFPGVGQMFRYTLRDESNHIEVFRHLLVELLRENPEICTADFRNELVQMMREAVALEKEFIRDCLPVNSVGLTLEEFESYIDFIADRRLRGCGLPELHPGIQDPLPWLDEVILMLKEQNFFEGKVTDYQKVAGFMSEIFKTDTGNARECLTDLKSLWPPGPLLAAPPPTLPAVPSPVLHGAASISGTSAKTICQIGGRQFVLDKAKAKAAFAAKRVVNGRETMTFNLLPLKYGWAYELYKQMKADHWGPLSPDIQMRADVARWQAADFPAGERSLLQLAIGWLATARKMTGADLQHVVRSLVTAPELKLVLGRETHDDNIRQEALLYAAHTFGLNIHECENLCLTSPLIAQKNAFAKKHTSGLQRGMDLTHVENLKLLARSLFVFGQCLKGLQFYGLFGALMHLQQAGRFPRFMQMLSCILRDEAHYTEFFRQLFLSLLAENPELKDASFREELRGIMHEAATLEKTLIRQGLPMQALDLKVEDYERFIDHAAHCRLKNCGLPTPAAGTSNPLPWLPALLHLDETAGHAARFAVLETCNDDDL
ncbi:ribonucleotide-diphosphate reductase subunit beta [Prosthecobacter sp.]|uniref:ribonucleotide-diphosphate reductase subunit beta n=1 Tax=Prosthecobacter sp. TaxID=1965333 RepID=UPI003784E712